MDVAARAVVVTRQQLPPVLRDEQQPQRLSFVCVDVTGQGPPADHQQPPPPHAARDVVLVVDVSGSMSGVMDSVRETVRAVWAHLHPTDRLAIVPFGSDARVALPLSRVADVPDAHAREVTNGIVVDGGTNMEAGLATAFGDGVLGSAAHHNPTLVVLLSDGQPMIGITDAPGLQAIVQSGVHRLPRSARVSVVSLGFTPSHNAALLQALSLGGHVPGRYVFLQTNADVGVAVADCLGSSESLAALDVTVALRCSDARWKCAAVESVLLGPPADHQLHDGDQDDDDGGDGDEHMGGDSDSDSDAAIFAHLPARLRQPPVELAPHPQGDDAEVEGGNDDNNDNNDDEEEEGVVARVAQLAHHELHTFVVQCTPPPDFNDGAALPTFTLRISHTPPRSDEDDDEEEGRGNPAPPRREREERVLEPGELRAVADAPLLALHLHTHLLRVRTVGLLQRLADPAASLDTLGGALEDTHSAVLTLLQGAAGLEGLLVLRDEGILQQLERDVGEAMERVDEAHAAAASSGAAWFFRRREQVRMAFRQLAQEHLHQQSWSTATALRTTYATPQQMAMRLRFITRATGGGGGGGGGSRRQLAVEEPGLSPLDVRLRREACSNYQCFVQLAGWRERVIGVGVVVYPRTARERRKGLIPRCELSNDYLSVQAFNEGVRVNLEGNRTLLDREDDQGDDQDGNQGRENLAVWDVGLLDNAAAAGGGGGGGGGGGFDDAWANFAPQAARHVMLVSSARGRINAWLPVFINAAHWEVAKQFAPAAISTIATQFNDLFKPEDALRVCSRLMCAMVVRFTVEDQRASARALQMYCDVHRLFLAMADEHPEVLEAAEAQLDRFVAQPDMRTRKHTPDLGVLVQYLAISARHSWDTVKAAYVPEMVRRQACRVGHIPLHQLEPVRALLTLWRERRPSVSHVTLFNRVFLRRVARPPGKPLTEVKAGYDRRWGRCDGAVVEELKAHVARFADVSVDAGIRELCEEPGMSDEEVAELLLWALENANVEDRGCQYDGSLGQPADAPRRDVLGSEGEGEGGDQGGQDQDQGDAGEDGKKKPAEVGASGPSTPPPPPPSLLLRVEEWKERHRLFTVIHTASHAGIPEGEMTVQHEPQCEPHRKNTKPRYNGTPTPSGLVQALQQRDGPSEPQEDASGRCACKSCQRSEHVQAARMRWRQDHDHDDHDHDHDHDHNRNDGPKHSPPSAAEGGAGFQLVLCGVQGRLQEAQVAEELAKAGVKGVVEVVMRRDKRGRCRGSAWLRFQSMQFAAAALLRVNVHKLEKRPAWALDVVRARLDPAFLPHALTDRGAVRRTSRRPDLGCGCPSCQGNEWMFCAACAPMLDARFVVGDPTPAGGAARGGAGEDAPVADVRVDEEGIIKAVLGARSPLPPRAELEGLSCTGKRLCCAGAATEWVASHESLACAALSGPVWLEWEFLGNASPGAVSFVLLPGQLFVRDPVHLSSAWRFRARFVSSPAVVAVVKATVVAAPGGWC